MNGSNGARNGHRNPHLDTLQWKIGLINSDGKYLTAETFGFKINASAPTLRKKQFWTLVQDTTEEVVYLKSHLNKYLAGDAQGNATADSDEKDQDTKFVLEYHKDGSGRWAFKNVVTGYYFGGAEDNLRCYEKLPTDREWWVGHLAVHPQVNLRNVNRKRYAHLDINDSEIHCNEIIPWGADSLITIEFCEGKYGVKTCDGRYLHRDGQLVSERGADTLYTLEIRSGQFQGLAFRDCVGKYLTAVGPLATMRARNKVVTKDELFTLTDSHPQATFIAHNGKMVSTKQGIDVTANQDEVTDRETFQLEFDTSYSKWSVRTVDDKYWLQQSNGGIQATSMDANENTMFDLEWQSDGKVALKAKNMYVTGKMNGALYATSETVTNKEQFQMTLVNRPILVLRCDYGFVGFKSASSNKLECNKSVYDLMQVEHGENGTYYIKASNGRYWSISSDGSITAESDQPHAFIFEFHGYSKFAIKSNNGMYLKGEQNGLFGATARELKYATLWEY
ncbi:unnamed protein product [Owenia fusiformis]|uniref:Fascin n=1 Tax=Owenia fusiformis TaxID=6347 RepID=A0A8J1XZR5_OWEFU|nr:unnamed protein product [Owenia fusiformis]